MPQKQKQFHFKKELESFINMENKPLVISFLIALFFTSALISIVIATINNNSSVPRETTLQGIIHLFFVPLYLIFALFMFAPFSQNDILPATPLAFFAIYNIYIFYFVSVFLIIWRYSFLLAKKMAKK